MPKKRSVKDQARYYTTAQRTRIRPQEQPEEPIKDVTTQLQELRLEQNRERMLSKQVTETPSLPIPSPLGFIPADYSSCPEQPPPRTVRRVPGPPPPPSWIRRPAERKLGKTSITELVRAKTVPLPNFPDLEIPRPGSLLHHTLCSLGMYFYEHQEVNRYYLPQLGIQVKQWLLTYIAAKNIPGGISKAGLDVLFPQTVGGEDPEEMPDILALSRKDEADLRYLDLSDALQSLSLAQLRNFLSPSFQQISLSPSDEWQHFLPRFPNLTHLSLDVSPIHKPQIDHLKLAHLLSDHCTRLTHISLAGLFTTITSVASLVYLSKHLVCLEYVDISRTPILHAKYGTDYTSSWDAFDWSGTPVLHRLDWGGGWRNVRTLVVRKCEFTKELEDAARTCILEKRGGPPWIRIITT
jgi:hypothetical protein